MTRRNLPLAALIGGAALALAACDTQFERTDAPKPAVYGVSPTLDRGFYEPLTDSPALPGSD